MASGWVHAVIDLIVFGRIYFDGHKYKDAPSKKLGSKHRTERHPYYWQYKKRWSLSNPESLLNPFPEELKHSILKTRDKDGKDKAEKKMSWIAHDYIDRIWNNLSPRQRSDFEGFCAWILFNPSVLSRWAGVYVLGGRIARVIEGREIWEDCPELKREYKRLYRYVKAISYRMHWSL